MGVAPKSYLPNYREFYERRWFAPGDDRELEWITVAGQDVRFGPDLIFRCLDVPGLDLHVEVCEDMWVPDPAERRGRTGRRHRPRQPVGQPDHGGAGGGPSTAGPQCERALRGGVRLCSRRPGRVDHRPQLGRPDADLRVRRPARRGGALPRRARAARSPTSTSTGCARNGCARGPSTTTDARTTSAPPASASSSGSWSRRTATSGCAARSTGSRSCPTTPSDSSSTATRPTTSRSPASSSGWRAIGSPKAVIGVSGGLDSTHALIVACKAMDRLGRPRSDVLAFTMPGFATGSTTKGYATRLSEALGVTFEELDIRPAAEQMLADMGHPYSRGREGLRRHLRERPGRPALRLPLPPRQPARRHRRRHRRPLRAGARLVHLRGR